MNSTILSLVSDNNFTHKVIMNILNKILIIVGFLFIISCSASYEELKNNSYSPSNEFSKHLLNQYEQKADFEAKEMHDWNSAKLYSEKALSAAKGNKILPEKISYWKISPDKRYDLITGYNNLMTIYEEATSLDPFNLAKAISSLDCWSEQQEENWQDWDINKCRNDFLDAMHAIYNTIKDNQKPNVNNKILNKSKDSATLVTQDFKNNNIQIVYFDFDKFNLSSVSTNEIKKFIYKNKDLINKYIIVGHTDTVGTKEYNQKLSIERAVSVKNILLELGINAESIKIVGKGENDLSIETEDGVPHPANRRAEISPLN